MTLYSDTVSIAATTAGVAGSINVPIGAKLIGMNLAYFSATGALPTKVNITWPNAPQPFNFMQNAISNLGTSGGANCIAPTPSIPLGISVANANTVTITVTSTGNLTVQVSLMWEAA